MPRFVDSGVARALICRIREIPMPSRRRARFITANYTDRQTRRDDMKCLLVLVSLSVVVACSKTPQQNTSRQPSTATQAAPAPAPAPAPTPVTSAAAAPAPGTPSAGALASQETNWNGIMAEVTEFRRKGNTLTAKVRLTNHGSQE